MRNFGIISSRLHRSAKFRLCDDAAQLVYVYLHTSWHGNSAGCFHISLPMLASDRGRDEATVSKALDDLEHVGLIRRNAAEDLVQVVRFFDSNCPSSRPQLSGPVKILDSLPACHAVTCAKIELAVEIFARALEFSSVEARDAFHDRSQKWLSTAEAVAAIEAEPDLLKDHRDAIVDILMIGNLKKRPLERPLESPVQSKDTDKTTEKTKTTTTEKTTDTEKTTETGPNHVNSAIDELNRRARGQK